MVGVNGASKRWLKCQIDQGMFSDEFAVTYPVTGNASWSVFVPQSAVRGEAGKQGRLEVVVLQEAGKMLAVLPTPQKDIVAVAEQDVAESP